MLKRGTKKKRKGEKKGGKKERRKKEKKQWDGEKKEDRCQVCPCDYPEINLKSARKFWKILKFLKQHKI